MNFTYQKEKIQSRLSINLHGDLQMGCLLWFYVLGFYILHYEAEKQGHGVMGLVSSLHESVFIKLESLQVCMHRRERNQYFLRFKFMIVLLSSNVNPMIS